MADSYIVRSYRREWGLSKNMLAIVADVNDKGDRPFSSAEELWCILEEKRGSVNEHKPHRGGHYGKREWQG